MHHLTNWVTILDCAQVVKTLRASPVMAHAPEEVGEMAKIASALVLNIGTLTVDLIEAMKTAAASAHQKRIPVILDMCGAGATGLRDQKCLELLETGRMSIIKGNASEVARMGGVPVQTRGVDAAEVSANLVSVAQQLARARRATVVVTGKEDIVTDGARTCLVRNGHPLMTQVVGTGCMAASVIGAFAAVESDLVVAEVGIDLTIKKVDFNTALQLQCNYQYELATQKKGNVPFFNYQQHHSKWIRPGKILSNISQYSNPRVDSLYDQWVYHATSDEERNKATLEV